MLSLVTLPHCLARRRPPTIPYGPSASYTLIFSTSAGLIINPLLYKVPYDAFRDLAPVSLECVNWYAMLASAKTPPAIIAKLNAEMAKMIADPPFAQRLIELGSEPQSSTPAELRAYMRKESERWDRVIKAANIKIER